MQSMKNAKIIIKSVFNTLTLRDIGGGVAPIIKNRRRRPQIDGG